ncbi:laccase [Lactarius pseudohatsudake]|nr:laccase [Lactarius pseudohatsudake]
MVWLRSFFVLLLNLVLLSAVPGRVSAIGPTAQLQIQDRIISPDGFRRSATLPNGRFPGPVIRGNKGDTFSIDVLNQLTDRNTDRVTSVHWHGIFQKGSNYADGSAFVSQCPVIPDQSFTYKFRTGEQAGTYWYHSHFKTQYCDGLRGALVIYDPDDPHLSLYDVDNENTIITLADWYHYISVEAPLVPEPNSTLINGIGRYSGGPSVPLAVVNVVRGTRLNRLRLVSISCDPAFTFSIDGHQLTIIEVDGVNHQPLLVDSLQIFAGQRYSVVLNANQPIGNYWLRSVPNVGNQGFAGGTNVAILHYRGAIPRDPSPDHLTRNIPASVLPLKETDLHVGFCPGSPILGGADVNINLDVSIVNTSQDGPFIGRFLVNGVPFRSPNDPVLLQILSGARTPDLLPKGSIFELGRNHSVEVSIPAGVLGGPHPIHLHGHAFHVVRSAGNSTYNFANPVIRDVVSIGDTGDNVTIRFFTDNPGPWFLRCHNNWHLERGFAVVFAERVPEVSVVGRTPSVSPNVSL